MTNPVMLRDRTAIVGIGATEFSKNSGRSELRLAVEAVLAALDDAGLAVDEVDGMCTFTMDNNAEAEVFRAIGGETLRFFSRTHYGGGGACGAVLHAAMAVSLGVCDVCVVYRGLNERSGHRFGQGIQTVTATAENALFEYHKMHGLQTPAAMTAMTIRRYMHQSGATEADFATLAVSARRYAATNPKAFFFGMPITSDDYHQSRMIADPLRLLDCCQESDGAVAIVITSRSRSQSLRQKPVSIKAAAQASTRSLMNLTNYYCDDIAVASEIGSCARQLYSGAGLGPDDIQAAMIYDHFGPTVLPALEGLGFCEKGEAREFIKNGTIDIAGRLPLNTHGGQIGEAYMHGLNGIGEAVRQLRGTAVNQVARVEHVLVTSGSGVPTSGLILGVV